MIQMGMIGYLNALPFHIAYPFEKAPVHFTFGPPTTLNAKLKNKELDLSFVSSVEFLKENYTQISPFGISAHQSILSVTLYLKGSIASLNHSPIGITPESATSIALLKVLCHHFWNVNPLWIPLTNPKEHSAFLLIGDQALKNTSFEGYHTIDLASAWFECTKLPFVFALLATHKNKNFKEIEEGLETSLEWSEQHKSALIEKAHSLSNLPPKLLQKYYSLCRYRLNDKDLEGFRLFTHLFQELFSLLTKSFDLH